ncbi:AAA family ATPase [Myroides marinus]|uniref:shikimate kinase n=1 Tax=Myroides marinus TaxID=703342 RepID=UPI002574FF50|nr:shikimate kinase [Myroides marinus]MDM1355787.1 AAA family ATPase [Myroides marinus]MDM1363030.1 AAA family ATPase [Myroides marinus]MDM1373534.1 AAA family ATPase [Myroides marinus]MDM1391505.1 AAA family ATPase [Myroides marinus]MDM1405625.1 AAA family ATPase [Myroides marinus]
MKKILLLGYMGSGKSTIGKILAERLGFAFIDLDAEIEKKQQMSISTMFKTKGEVYFRKQEHLLLHEIIDTRENFILSLGGGTPCYANNHLALQRDDVMSFYLKGSIKTLVERLEKEKEHRPLLNQNSDDTLETFIAKHLFDRSYFYHQAKNIISIDNKSPMEVTQDIINLIN